MTFEEYSRLSRDERLELAAADMLRVLVATVGPQQALHRMRAAAANREAG